MTPKTVLGLMAIGVQLVLGRMAGPQEGAVLLPWHDEQATARQVVRVTAPVPRVGPVVGLALAGPQDQPLRIVDAADPAGAPLPLYRDRAGKVWVRAGGETGPQSPRHLVAYWSQAPGWQASAVLDAKPDETDAADDYATATYGDAWDFDEGDQENITGWGDRPTEYGAVEVRDGRLIVPVTGNDPYFIWGIMFGTPGDRPTEHIDSGIYRYLRMRVRQDREAAEWTVYLTDAEGVFRSYDFQVRGPEWQEIELDLPRLFGSFWDGREFRALRIDPTNFAPGTTVEIDWVRLLRPGAEATAGPVVSREQVAARALVKTLKANAPGQAKAGERPVVRVSGLDEDDRAVAGVPMAVALREEGEITACHTTISEGSGWARCEPGVGTQAGEREWVVGVCDDLGRPAEPTQSARLIVTPAELDHYELIADRRLVPVSRPRVRLTVWGADRFGNRIPAAIERPRWQVSGGARVPEGVLKGQPAETTIACSATPLTRHQILLLDEAGRRGQLELMTMALKDRGFTLSPNGYLLDPAGKLYMPLGGFYANWPSGLPKEDGSIDRALDLFPCGPQPYPHGFPWPPEVEQQVRDYLDLCHRHGVTGLRLMLRNMDLVGRADPVQVQATLHLLDLARPLGIRFNVVLFEDYNKPPYVNREVLEKVVLPRYTPAELEGLSGARARFLVEKAVLPQAALKYTDLDALAWQKEYLDDLLPHLAPREEVFCYELENEMVHPPMSWVNEITQYIRATDPQTLVLGNPGPHEWPEPWRWHGSAVELFSYHPYNDGQREADHGAVAYMRSKWAAACGKPMFTGEGGINQNRWQSGVNKASYDGAARGIRDQIWLSLCCGANGAFMWTASHELEMAQFGQVAPALEALGLDLLKMERRRPRVAMVMPNDGAANGRAYALAWRLLGLGVDFDALPDGEAAAAYETRIQAATADPAALDVEPELLRPTDGYQAAYLVSGDLGQVLVYLRNVAGGIVNVGDGRACYLREPKAAEAGLTLVGDAKWGSVRAYDLDEGRAVTPRISGDRRMVLVAQDATHDYVVSLRK